MAVTGVIWLLLNLVLQSQVPTVCITKQLTGAPCPTCGVTESIFLLLNGNPGASLRANAAGPMILFMILAAGIGIFRNMVLKQRSVSNTIIVFESYLVRGKPIVYLLLLSLFLNWLLLLYRHFT